MSDKNRGPIINGKISAGRNVTIGENVVVNNHERGERGDRRRGHDEGEDINISTRRNGRPSGEDEEGE